MNAARGSVTSALPLVSVVIPTYNREDLVGRALKSVLRQTCRELEVIVVDDGSTDATPRIMAGVADPRVRYEVLEGNYGGAHARNVGIELARGEYVAFLDSDDYWLPDKLDKQLAVFREDEAVGVVCTSVYFGLPTRLVPSAEPVYSGEVFGRLVSGWCPATTSCVAVRRDLLSECRFDETLPGFHDYELWLGLALRTRFGALAEPLVVFEWNRSDRITSNVDRRLASLLMVEAKWRSEAVRRGLGDSFDAHFARWRRLLLQKRLMAAPRPPAWRERAAVFGEARRLSLSRPKLVALGVRLTVGDRAYAAAVRPLAERFKGIPRAPLEARIFA